MSLKFGEGEGLRFKTIKYCFEMEGSNPHGFESHQNLQLKRHNPSIMSLKFGEGGIRTHGADCSTQHLSRVPP